MRKVAYSVFKSTGNNINKWTGVGWIDGKDLIYFPTAKNGKRYKQTLKNAVSNSRQKPYDSTQYTGEMNVIEEIEIKTEYGSYDTREIEISYIFWFKYI